MTKQETCVLSSSFIEQAYTDRFLLQQGVDMLPVDGESSSFLEVGVWPV